MLEYFKYAYARFAQIVIQPSELDSAPNSADPDSRVAIVLRLFFAIIGSVALLIIVIAGMKFTLSGGNPDATTKARNTIIYALVGLVLSLLAFTLINFVVSRVG